MFIAEYTNDIRHIAGVNNVVADALSRPAAMVVPAPGGEVDLSQLAREQLGCQGTQQLLSRDSLKLKQVKVEG